LLIIDKKVKLHHYLQLHWILKDVTKLQILSLIWNVRISFHPYLCHKWLDFNASTSQQVSGW